MGNSRPRGSPELGAVIADTYTIEALLGRGGMGSVFLASHTRLPGKRVAIKLLHVELTGDDVIARFRREALIASQLDHPNIVRVDDYNVTEDGTPYLVLEYLEGESLAQRLEAGPLPLDQVQSILRMVGSAVAAAHRGGIIHRDLKPQNIFLMPTEVDGQLVEVAKVLDFGISKMRGRDTVKTQESTLLGTPQYMAPEQATGNHAAVDERTDVFALGAITYEMLTGKPAFSGENIPEVVFKVVYEQPAPLPAHLPDDVRATIQRAMQKDQDARFRTVNEFVEALTGRPLTQKASMISMPPRDAAPTTSKTGQAAFANTVDSGSVAKRMVSPHAETIASQRGDEGTPIPRSTAPSVQTAPPVQPTSKRGLVIGLAIACVVAIAAVIVVIATRESATPRDAVAVADAAVAVVAVDAAVTVVADAAVADAADAVATDAAIAAVPADAAVVAVVDDAGTKKTPGATVTKPKGDPVAAEDLRKAHAAYKTGDYEGAKVLCNAVVGSSTASTAQIDEALLLRGTIHCLHVQNVGLTQGDIRALSSASIRAQLKARCGL